MLGEVACTDSLLRERRKYARTKIKRRARWLFISFRAKIVCAWIYAVKSCAPMDELNLSAQTQRIADLQLALHNLGKRNDEVTILSGRLRTMLEKIQWAGCRGCPECGGQEEKGHGESCKLAALI